MQVEEIFIWGKKWKKNRQISLLDDYCYLSPSSVATSWVILITIIFNTLQIDFTFKTYDKFFNLSLVWSRSTPRKMVRLEMTGVNLKGKGVFALCMLHLPFINHNYIASSVITPRILNLKEPILLQSLIVSFKLFESVDFFLCS